VLVTDSGCDLSPAWLEAHGVTLVPLDEAMRLKTSHQTAFAAR